jgi:hypothetical protein
MPPTENGLAHELDVAWTIALWLAIHGGEPAPETAAAQAVAALAPYLSGAAYSAAVSELETEFATLGIQAAGRTEETGPQSSN